MRANLRRLRVSVTQPRRSIRAIICFAPAPGCSWKWGRRSAYLTTRGSMRAPSMPVDGNKAGILGARIEPRVPDYERLDAGSEYAGFITVNRLLREGKLEEAQQAVRRVPINPRDHREFLEACLQSGAATALDKLAARTQNAVLAEPDPEKWYQHGAIMAFCAKQDIALQMVGRAIQQNYCAYSALPTDPLLDKLHREPPFDKLLTAADNCQKAAEATPDVPKP